MLPSEISKELGEVEDSNPGVSVLAISEHRINVDLYEEIEDST